MFYLGTLRIAAEKLCAKYGIFDDDSKWLAEAIELEDFVDVNVTEIEMRLDELEKIGPDTYTEQEQLVAVLRLNESMTAEERLGLKNIQRYFLFAQEAARYICGRELGILDDTTVDSVIYYMCFEGVYAASLYFEEGDGKRIVDAYMAGAKHAA